MLCLMPSRVHCQGIAATTDGQKALDRIRKDVDPIGDVRADISQAKRDALAQASCEMLTWDACG